MKLAQSVHRLLCTPRVLLPSLKHQPLTPTASMSFNNSSSRSLRDMLRTLAPTLSPTAHKGQAGRMVIIGGSKPYTGAPYFSAMTTMKLGVDLTTVYCTTDASTPIKSYSPDLMVTPLLIPESEKGDQQQQEAAVRKELDSMVPRCHCVVIGMGLSKDPYIQHQVSTCVIPTVKQHNIPLVIDGDGLAIINDKPDLVKGYTHCILTPNAMEFKRLWIAVFGEDNNEHPVPPMGVPLSDDMHHTVERPEHDGDLIDVHNDVAKHTAQLAAALGGVTILRKGQIDVISDGKQAVYCCATGGLKRVGGQGDITSGSVGTHLCWSYLREQAVKDQSSKDKRDASKQTKASSDAFSELSPVLLAAYGGALFTRLCSRRGYSQWGRSMTTSSLMDIMHEVVHELYPAPPASKI